MFRRDLPTSSLDGIYTEVDVVGFNRFRQIYRERVAWFETHYEQIAIVTEDRLRQWADKYNVGPYNDLATDLISGLLILDRERVPHMGLGALMKFTPSSDNITNIKTGCDMITAFYLPQQTQSFSLFTYDHMLVKRWKHLCEGKPLQDILDEAHRIPSTLMTSLAVDVFLPKGCFKKPSTKRINGVTYQRVILFHPFLLQGCTSVLPYTYATICPPVDFYVEVVQLALKPRTNLWKIVQTTAELSWAQAGNDRGELFSMDYSHTFR